MAETGNVHVGITKENSQQKTGLWYRCDGRKVSVMKKAAAALVVFITAAFILTGTYSCQSIGDIAVLLSWLLLFLPVMFSWLALFQILRMGNAVTRKQYKKGPERLRQSGAFGVLLSGASAFSCGYFVVTGDVESIAVEIGMLARIALEFLLFFGILMIGRYYISQMEE